VRSNRTDENHNPACGVGFGVWKPFQNGKKSAKLCEMCQLEKVVIPMTFRLLRRYGKSGLNFPNLGAACSSHAGGNRRIQGVMVSGL